MTNATVIALYVSRYTDGGLVAVAHISNGEVDHQFADYDDLAEVEAHAAKLGLTVREPSDEESWGFDVDGDGTLVAVAS